MKALILLTLFIFSPCILANQSFKDFINDIKLEASIKGIDPAIVDELFGENPKPNAFINRRYVHRPPVIRNGVPVLPKSPAEKFEINQRKYLSSTRLAKAKKFLKDPTTLAILEKIEAKYGVDKEAIVALWSIESYFGLNQGRHNIPHVLATLAWHPKEKRNAMFKRELFNAFKIYAAGHVTKENFTGSWAGAMGQVQFMPSTFLDFAKDGDGDGKADIWNNKADAFASAANYLRKLKWEKGKAWKDKLILTKKISIGQFYETGLSQQNVFARNSQGDKIYKNGKAVVRKFDGYMISLKTLKSRGVPIPKGLSLNGYAYLYLPHGNKAGKEAYLLYDNFHAVFSWNFSSYFAFGILSIMDELKKTPTVET